MNLLSEHVWQPKYSPDDGNLVALFYLPALACAVRYDRSTGFFSVYALILAMRGLERLIRNGGRMRLLVGCTLGEAEVSAIERGIGLRDTVEAAMLAMPLVAPDTAARDALELLAWMVAKGYLDVKVAVPCDANRQPLPGVGLFHEKAGILEDRAGNRLAFNGSINETAYGWTHNWESFHVYTSWGDAAHVHAEEATFQRLWANQARRALVLDVPTAVRQALLTYLPPQDQLPIRLHNLDDTAVAPHAQSSPAVSPPMTPPLDRRRLLWGFLRHAPSFPHGGERIGEATCAMTPWPHQVRAFHRMYDHWPPKLLIADEVGLGKTIQAGMLLRQAWLSGRARRILIMTPKAVLRQWQIELREKCNLNWPIYDGHTLSWCPSPAFDGPRIQQVSRQEWHTEPCVLASSYLLRRRDRERELLEDAAPWDLIVLDEAHHARRRGGGMGSDDRPNQLLRLMQALRHRTAGLVLLTATPMQVSPIEVYDLLSLLGLPPVWHVQAFLDFFAYAAKANPSHGELAHMASLFRAVEQTYGEVSLEDAQRFAPNGSRIGARKLLRTLRDPAATPLRQLETPERRAAVRLMKAHTPLRRLVSRYTRELLRQYFRAGKLSMAIAERVVEDRFVDLTEAERRVYNAVEHYISTTYNAATAATRTAVGFVMTIYRRRLASSFYALARTLDRHLLAVTQPSAPSDMAVQDGEEDILDDETADEAMDTEEAERLEREALSLEEQGDIHDLLRAVQYLPTDTKARVLHEVLRDLRAQGYTQVMIFTQYTDTMDFLRDELLKTFGPSIICFSGRGGETPTPDGNWRVISRDATKQLFRAGRGDILLCTDAAAEGLNFQFCGALVNYDMPWNPMRVEQRIGRIDRLGQQYAHIRIVNLHYRDTVETDVYTALRTRIQLFQTFVGRLQPILARLPRAIADVALGPLETRAQARDRLMIGITSEVHQAEASGFDLDEVTEAELDAPLRSQPLFTLEDLQRLLTRSALLPPGIEVTPSGPKDFAFTMPGMLRPIRVTTDPAFFDEHPESTELWSPGSPVFPEPDIVASPEEASTADLRSLFSEPVP
jgi:superfamily II DNA or RNA helicase